MAPTPPPESIAASAAPAAAVPPEPIAEAAATPTPPEPASGVEGALPMRPMGSDGSAASSDLANHIGSSTPAPAATGESDVELQGSDELVVEEGPDAAQVDASASVATPPPRPTSVPTTPPPIPGSFLKTPGPEVKAAPPALAATPSDPGHGPLLPALPILPEALSLRPRRPKRSKPWFEEVFDEDYLRTLPFMRADQTLREVEFISNALTAAPGSEILDVACGYGRHAIELVQRGYNVTGLDLSLPLLIRAADEAQRRALSVNFVHADMREMAFEKQFDGAYSMLTSFGYFDEETNLRVAERIGRALKPGKRFLLDIVNRDYVVADLPVRVWWEGTGCVVLEEVDFNFHTSRINTHRSIVFEDGRQLEQELSVRAYSLHEIGRLLRQAGFRVIDVSGGLAMRGDFFGSASRNLLIVAEKREDEA
ncbi:MAG TPA: class I SAM-dependent methyltransferase [Polyangia bacterium]